MEEATQKPLDFEGEPSQTTPPAAADPAAQPAPAEPATPPEPSSVPITEEKTIPPTETPAPAAPAETPAESSPGANQPVADSRFQNSFIGGRKENPLWKDMDGTIIVSELTQGELNSRSLADKPGEKYTPYYFKIITENGAGERSEDNYGGIYGWDIGTEKERLWFNPEPKESTPDHRISHITKLWLAYCVKKGIKPKEKYSIRQFETTLVGMPVHINSIDVDFKGKITKKNVIQKFL